MALLDLAIIRLWKSERSSDAPKPVYANIRAGLRLVLHSAECIFVPVSLQASIPRLSRQHRHPVQVFQKFRTMAQSQDVGRQRVWLARERTLALVQHHVQQCEGTKESVDAFENVENDP